MKSYIIPTLKQNAETMRVHNGTKDLKSHSSPEEISRKMINLKTSCNTQTNKVILFSILPRYSNVNDKTTKVNRRLKEECVAKSICFINHSNISPKHDKEKVINESKSVKRSS